MKLALALGGALAAGLLCRYTVRDIGFVDLHGAIYEIIVVHADDATLPDAHLEALQAKLRGSNVTAKFHRRSDFAGEWPDELLGEMPEEMASRREGDSSSATPAAAYFLKSTKRTGLFEFQPPPADLQSGNGFSGPESVARTALHSPLRQVLIDEALHTFAFLLVAESNQDDLNSRVDQMVDAAQERLQSLAPQLPRPISQPIRVLRLPLAHRDREAVLLWSLGLEKLADSQAAVAVFYGRAKRIGPALTDEHLTERRLLSQLALIGQSCECDTVRDWAAEPSLPHRWSKTQAAEAVHALGFEPQSPMVKSEVMRILAKGPDPNAPRRDRGIGLENEDIFLGYGEFNLDPDGAPAQGGQVNSAGAVPAAPLSAARSATASAGDWGFEDLPTRPEPATSGRAISPPTVSWSTWMLLACVLAISALLGISIFFRRGGR